MRNMIIVSTLLLAACGQSGQKVTYKDSEGNDRSISVSDDDGERTVNSDDGLIRAKGTQGGAKARFPEYAPQYPGATIQSVVDINAGPAGQTNIKQHVITMMSKDTPDAVIAFYKGKISASGKSVKQVGSAAGPMLMVGGPSPLDMEAMVTAMPITSGGSSINVSVTSKDSPS
jgi:hypothetical protein